MPEFKVFVGGKIRTVQYEEIPDGPPPRPPRPPRRMPTRKSIARYHGRPAGSCWRCGRPEMIERAHIVDRCYGGLDSPNNLALICAVCHKDMPIIRPADMSLGREYVGLS